MNRMTTIAACALLAGCGHGGAGPASAGPASGDHVRPSDWHRVATDADRARLRGWRDDWMAAVAKARASGNGAAMDAEGPLLDPDMALAGAMPPPGDYRCRVIKLGGRTPAARDFVAYPMSACRIGAQGPAASFYRIGGAQRPVGLIFPDTRERAVFLGTMMFGDETHAINYGHDTSRDMAGFVERIGARRWRMVLPAPRFESMLDVIELTPGG